MMPELFSIGPLTVYSYPIVILLGIALGAYLFWKRELEPASYRAGASLPGKHLLPLLLLSLAAGVAGARIGFLLLHPEYWEVWTWGQMAAFWGGGLVFHGGFLAGLAGSWAYTRVAGFSWLQVMDQVSPYLALAYGIGRIGCFLNGCCYGIPTELPWGVTFPMEEVARHPTQLYATFTGVLIFFLLLHLKAQSHFRGEVFFWLVLLHSAYRFLVEMVRVTEPVAWHLTAGQWVALALALVAGFLLLRNYRSFRSGSGIAS